MLKRDFLHKLGALASGVLAAGALSGPASGAQAPAATEEEDDELTGLWEMTVKGTLGTYRYYYAIAGGAYTGTGNVDAGFGGFTYSPTMGAYAREGQTKTYRYVEKGWAFDRKGNNVGTFQSQGTFALDATGRSFAGPGTFLQFDLKGKQIVSERFTATATKQMV